MEVRCLHVSFKASADVLAHCSPILREWIEEYRQSGAPLVLPAEQDRPEAWQLALSLLHQQVPPGLPDSVLDYAHMQLSPTQGPAGLLQKPDAGPGLLHKPDAAPVPNDVPPVGLQLEQLYHLAHKYSMQEVMRWCQARVLTAVACSHRARDDEAWAPQLGRTDQQLLARYEARVQLARQGLSIVDPLDPTFVLRWLALAVQHHDDVLEAAVRGWAQVNMPHMATQTFLDAEQQSAFNFYWQELGQEYVTAHFMQPCVGAPGRLGW